MRTQRKQALDVVMQNLTVTLGDIFESIRFAEEEIAKHKKDKNFKYINHSLMLYYSYLLDGKPPWLYKYHTREIISRIPEAIKNPEIMKYPTDPEIITLVSECSLHTKLTTEIENVTINLFTRLYKEEFGSNLYDLKIPPMDRFYYNHIKYKMKSSCNMKRLEEWKNVLKEVK